MANDETQFILENYKAFKSEIKQFNKLIERKNSKYNSLCDMKRQLFQKLSTYSEEDLDFLKEFIIAKTLRTDKLISVFLPIAIALEVAVLTVICSAVNTKYVIPFLTFILFLTLFLTFVHEKSVKKLGFYNTMLKLTEKVEEARGHTFNDSLAEEYRRSLTMSETAEEDNEGNEDNLSEET